MTPGSLTLWERIGNYRPPDVHSGLYYDFRHHDGISRWTLGFSSSRTVGVGSDVPDEGTGWDVGTNPQG